MSKASINLDNRLICNPCLTRTQRQVLASMQAWSAAWLWKAQKRALQTQSGITTGLLAHLARAIRE